MAGNGKAHDIGRSQGSDPLTAVIALLRPHVVHPKLISGAGRWGVRYPRVDIAGYGLVLAGECHLMVEGAAPIRMSAGDFVLMPPSPGFVMASEADVEPVAVEAAESVGLVELRHGDQAADADFAMLGGYFRFDPANASLLSDLLPHLIHVQGVEAPAKRLAATIELATDEAMAGRPGRDLILERLVEVMLVEALRYRGEGSAAVEQPGLLRGLGDPRLARALRAIHAYLSRRWTVADLGREAGLSRSAFSERFASLVGMAPMEYLIRWRMAVAKDILLHEDMPFEELAFKIGYESASAFSTAFRKHVGRPPREFARDFRGGGERQGRAA